MKVGFFADFLNRERTGIGTYSANVLSSMRDVRPDVEFVLFDLGNLDETSSRKFETRKIRSPWGVNTPARQIAWRRLLRMKPTMTADLDLLHDPYDITPALRQRRKPWIVTVHDLAALHAPSDILRVRLSQHWKRSQWKLTWKSADAIITTTRSVSRELRAVSGIAESRVFVTPLGVDPRFRPTDPAAVLSGLGLARPYVLYVGTLHERKNLIELILGFERVAERFPAVSLALAGGIHEGSEKVIRRVHASRYSDRIRLLGYVDDGSLPALYSGAEAFVFPSRYEGFGLPPLEAMACGCPVIASDRSPFPEVLGDAALLPASTPEAIATALVSVLDSACLTADLRKRGVQHSQSFNWRETARKTAEAYDAVLTARARSGPSDTGGGG